MTGEDEGIGNLHIFAELDLEIEKRSAQCARCVGSATACAAPDSESVDVAGSHFDLNGSGGSEGSAKAALRIRGTKISTVAGCQRQAAVGC